MNFVTEVVLRIQAILRWIRCAKFREIYDETKRDLTKHAH
jgi:hypothetical protein